MIDLKEAIERAKLFIIELNGKIEEFQIEEVGLSEDKKNWNVTISYLRKIDSPNEIQITLGLETRRVYKKVVIDSENEKVVGMIDGFYNRREAV